MATVQQILDAKGGTLHTLPTEAMVVDALKLMAEEDVGSVLVMSGGKLAGIFTERHYTRKVFLAGKTSPTTPLADVMATDFYGVEPGQSAEACMAVMVEKHVRHLPVLKDGELAGIVSIGDLMKSIIDEEQFNASQLVRYVRGMN
ncbi:CBS domain-containing protein [Leisingera aquaemixtae]|jgi:CBS domain-containing protein|uniref:Hypoxic response protein 1 n=1 Tax=Leisingera aquaemixtae TaxID=1396826 RepID=A0A0P1H9J5_9RHOB|nr:MULTISPECIES: CBS domain-containing protein [Leisingera]QDI76521.1 CBS domain-containing protein [Leisingera aquaemixtae]UWQ25805.1 CBS domain-containing protein [Leisingera aquaemixtae]UWQ38306.1 CBS domain-containing protein [Leisingera aquaemixtae]UWQ46715.1 CBS domain-containing protein [Leisingera aquaemixtae]CUH99892.1 Hypoxic response protein 1 [Leisingera aquaemixtae]